MGSARSSQQAVLWTRHDVPSSQDIAQYFLEVALTSFSVLQVLKLFPLHVGDDDDFPVRCISQRLQPWVQRLLLLGAADLRDLRLNDAAIACPQLLSQLPLRHLEPEIVSLMRLEGIMVAIGECSTLLFLRIVQFSASWYSLYHLALLPDLCLRKASYLKQVHLQACFPGGRLCQPPGCQLKLDLVACDPFFWERKWQSENGNKLRDCVPAMSLQFSFAFGAGPMPSHIRNFKSLQYLQPECPLDFTDLAMLQGIPHVKLELYWDTLLQTAGCWESLEIYRYEGFHITFADIDAFVRDNPKYLFVSGKANKAWQSMSTALREASNRQGVEYFACRAGRDATLSNIKDLQVSDFEMWKENAACSPHLVCMEQIWPKQCLQGCPSLPDSSPKADVTECDCGPSCTEHLDDSSTIDCDLDCRSGFADSDSGESHPESGPGCIEPVATVHPNDRCGALNDLEASPNIKRRERVVKLTSWGCLTWLAHKLKAIHTCMHGGRNAVVLAPGEVARFDAIRWCGLERTVYDDFLGWSH